MKRRDFFQKTGCGVCGALLAMLGLNSCAKKDEGPAEISAPAPAKEVPVQAAPSREEAVKKLLIDSQGMSEADADAFIATLKEKLPWGKQNCICKSCPTYVAEETETLFCHPLIGKSTIIKDEKGCECGKCPVYAEFKLKNSYYCTRGAELEQEAAKV